MKISSILFLLLTGVVTTTTSTSPVFSISSSLHHLQGDMYTTKDTTVVKKDITKSALILHDDMDTIYNNCRQILCWPPTDSLPTVVTNAIAYASTLNATCYWPDIDYTSQDRANWLTFNHLGRVTTMVQALTTPGSSAFDNATLAQYTHCALDVWLNRGFTNPNWWYQWIGVPLSLETIFVSLGLNRTTVDEQALFIRYSYNSTWWENDYGGGANLVWMLTIQILRSSVTRNETGLTQAFNAMWANCMMGNVSESWQGIVNDNMFNFHGHQAMSSAYGFIWVQSMLQFWQIATNTSFGMPTEREALLAAYLVEGNMQLSFSGRWDYGTQGRGIDRPGLYFTWGLPTDTIRQLGTTPGGSAYAKDLVYFANSIDGNVVPYQYSTNKYFWTTDFLTHHRPGWGASLKMHGNNNVWEVVPNECDNNECTVCEHTGDGVLNVYPSEEPTVAMDVYANIFPLLDWNAINGITVEHSTPVAICNDTGNKWETTYTKFVGGISNGIYGSGVMDTATYNTTIQRSWFFLDNVIFAIGSNLTNKYGNALVPADVWTTLASRMLPNNRTDPVRGTLTVGFNNGTVVSNLPDDSYSFPGQNISWFNIGGVGYWPTLQIPLSSYNSIQSANPLVGIYTAEKSGNFDTMGAYPQPVSGRTLTAYLDHGEFLPSSNPNNGYIYMIAPNVSASGMNALNTTMGNVLCVNSNVNVHGIATVPPTTNNGSITMVHFWNPNEGGIYVCPSLGFNITSVTNGLVLVQNLSATNQIIVSVAHPNLYNTVFTIEMDGIVATGTGCKNGNNPKSTLFSIPLPSNVNDLGSTVSVTCTLS